MSETNKSLRIRTQVNSDSFVTVDLNQTYDSFEILSLKMKSEDVYRLHSSNYGVIAGRVLANESFGVPNAKISVFIEGDFDEDEYEIAALYPYTSTSSKNGEGVKYNLLPDNKVDNCHQVVGTFPNKTYLLDNDALIEVFDKYYIYTTRTNNSGDYIIAGVPVGTQTLHMDLDLSDCGILSQRPRDFVYKGYTIEQFENPNQFKKSTDLESLSQIFRQDQVVNVIPFWGNADNGETIGITRADINVAFKFEPTCVFIGSLVADNSSNGISKKCIPTNQMGAMDELTTGEGTIEMIRKTPGGGVEEFQIRGTQLIDGNGVWCYQIPMNLDYMMTDEFGNMVPTDDPSKGIPTRTRVRFRISMHDMEKNTDNYFRAKVLVPHNPQNIEGTNVRLHENYDYEFGSDTREDSFRDLMWNNVYTVKSYIPRFQKSRTMKSERFTGIKHCNIYGNNNPMPYNNIRIRLPLMFTILCALIKTYIRVVYIINCVLNIIAHVFKFIVRLRLVGTGGTDRDIIQKLLTYRYLTIADGLCPDLENWYFAPVNYNFNEEVKSRGFFQWLSGNKTKATVNILKQTLEYLTGDFGQASTSSGGGNSQHSGGGGNNPGRGSNRRGKDSDGNAYYFGDSPQDENSVDFQNRDDNESVCITTKTDYLMACIEMALAQEYKVINFDFYNDWVNGVIYMPRWMRFIRVKRTFLFGLIKIKSKIKACMDNTKMFNKTRFYVQQCALSYVKDNDGTYTKISTPNGCKNQRTNKQKCHKEWGRKLYPIFGGNKRNGSGNGGIVHENQTSKQQYVYYLKPCEWKESGKKTILFANDIVLLGSLLECNLYGVPQAFKYLTSSSYVMPTNLALTNMDDDGYLYADDKNTICTTTSSGKIVESGVTQLEPSFSATTNYYSTTQNPIIYGEIKNPNDATINEEIFDDTIPLTEAAGIAWNYTGPGQGVKSNDVNKSLYMPGGHFLGISCTNSETNIKSCINLQRVCEAGSNISQRREEVRGQSNGDLQYRYFVPTGLISNDEINSVDFRTMFATMNQKRLLCNNRYDDKTGYPIYDFIYMRNAGFDGALHKEITTSNDINNQWNKKLTIVDEWSSLGGNIPKDFNYDNSETGETYTRTLENGNVDYYKFRLGLNSLDNTEQLKRFLSYDNSHGASLPQYENSFYFYFGLHNGATAFDEFNKQFFSVCESESILRRKLTMKVDVSDEDTCNLVAHVEINGTDAVDGLRITYNGTEIPESAIHINNGIYSVSLNNVPFGTYTFIGTDNSGVELIKVVEIGTNLINADIETSNFAFRINGATGTTVSQSAETSNSGYIKINEINFGSTSVIPLNNVTIVDNETGNYYGRQIASITTGSSIAARTRTEGNTLIVYLWKPDTRYTVYVWSACNKYYEYGTYLIEGIENIDLFLGSYYLPYSTKLSTLTGEWWNNIGGNNIDNWAKRFALFRQTDDDTAYFTNKVFSIDKRYNRQLDTALFGQPETTDESGNTILVDGYSFENDYRLPGIVSDSSVIPTNGPTSLTNGRKLFAEMAMNGDAIVANKLTETTISSISQNMVSGNTYYTIRFANTSLNGMAYIIRTPNGSNLYVTNNGNGTTYYYEGDSLNVGDRVSVYPVFYYPVMYRPFYANVGIVDWINLTLSLSQEEQTSQDATYAYNDERYAFGGKVHNGITYNNKFGNCTFNENEFTITRTNGTTDISNMNDVNGVIASFSGKSEITNGIMSYDSFFYSINGNTPTSADTGYDELIMQPNRPIPWNISDEISAVFANNISYRPSVGDSSRAIYYNDIDDIENDYYLIPRATYPCPIAQSGYVYYTIQEPMTQFPDVVGRALLLCRFGENSDAKFNVGGQGVVLNKPGSMVVVEFAGGIAGTFTIPINVSENSRINRSLVLPGITYASITGYSQSIKQQLKSNWDVSIEETYLLKPNVNIADYTEAIRNYILNENIPKIKLNFNEMGMYYPDTDYYCIAMATQIVGVKGSTDLIRVYDKFTKLNQYDSGAENPYLTVNGTAAETTITATSADTMVALSISSNVGWTISVDNSASSWLKISENGQDMTTYSGSGNKTLAAHVLENSGEERTGRIICSPVNEASLSDVIINIKQQAALIRQLVTIDGILEQQ